MSDNGVGEANSARDRPQHKVIEKRLLRSTDNKPRSMNKDQRVDSNNAEIVSAMAVRMSLGVS